jgi:hypothetical protein
MTRRVVTIKPDHSDHDVVDNREAADLVVHHIVGPDVGHADVETIVVSFP